MVLDKHSLTDRSQASHLNLRAGGISFRILIVLFACIQAAFPKGDDSSKSVLQKTATNDYYSSILINNIFNYYSNTGDGSYNPYTGSAAFEYPKASRNTVCYEDGIVWGGYQNGTLKAGGSAFRHGLQAGPILAPGTPTSGATAADPSDAKYRLFRVRPDINPSTSFTDVQKILADEEVPLLARDNSVTVSSLYDQYIKDWNEWPADKGAPFVDNNHNGTYEPSLDVPGVEGAGQTLWHVCNDLDSNRTKYMYGSLPIGLEFQRTIWAYRHKGALDNTIFTRNLIINKSGVRLDSVYVGQWSNPDLGDGSDDLVGCDTSRDLGFVYNGRSIDSYYGERVPSMGYRLLQGPVVAGSPSDMASFCGRMMPGYRNQRMTAFIFFVGGSAIYHDPNQGWYSGTLELYGMFHGKMFGTTAPMVDPNTGSPTTFALAGDPVAKQGWIDGLAVPPGNRRVLEASGPFIMMPADTQEVITATIIAQAGDRLSSISYLRSYADQIRTVYRSGFEIVQPLAPIVSAPSLSNEIVLTWSDSIRTAAIESFEQHGYKFEGYNVYALPGPEFKNAVRLATYDRIDSIGYIRENLYDETRRDFIESTVQWGTDAGLRRYYETKGDSLTNSLIWNYHTYYFAVSAYYVATQPDVNPRAVESDPAIVAVTPTPPSPGVRFGSRYNDTVSVRHVSGKSEGSVIAQVIDPTKITGHAYKVTFEAAGDSITWSLHDTTATPSRTVLSHQTNFSGDGDYTIVDGIQVRVVAPLIRGMKDWIIPNGIRRWSWSGAEALQLEGFLGAIGWNEPSVLFHINATRTVTANNLKRVRLKLAEAFSDTGKNGSNYYAGWNQDLVTNPNFSYGYRYVIGGTTPARPEFAPFLAGHVQGSWGFVDYKKGAVPFSAWDMEATPPARLAVGFTENNVADGLVDGRCWPPLTGVGRSNTDALGPREWFFVFNRPYSDAVPDTSLQKNILNNAMPVMWMGTVNRRLSTAYSAGDEFEIVPYYSPSEQDAYVFQTPATTNTPGNRLEDVERINVFPNPYFAGNLDEPNDYTRFVTISHLPHKANIRIFTLGGYLVRTYIKDDDLQTVRWDLTNDANFWVASGIYLIHIVMPELGKTKILKLAVIQQVYVPGHY
jgi:hypothetical protein